MYTLKLDIHICIKYVFFLCVWIHVLHLHYSSILCVYFSFVCEFDVFHVWILQLCVNLLKVWCGFTYFLTHLTLLVYSMCVFFFCVRIWRIACVNSSIVCEFVWILLLCVNLLTDISFKCVLFFCSCI